MSSRQRSAHSRTCRATADPGRRDVLKLAGLTALAPGLLAACGSDGPAYPTTITNARGAIGAALASSQATSVSVALIDRERVLWAEAFGWIDPAAGLRPTTDTLFNIGSCSKVLAAVAVMILVDRGVIELDAPLVRYLPDFRMASPEYTQVTVRMLISHASGFPGDDNRNEGGDVPFRGYAAQVMQTLAHSRLKHLPGEMSVYCNDGFTLVEPLVEAVSGRTYVDFVSDEILAPLDMKLSRFAREALPAGSYAPGYVGETRLGQEFMNAYASGGLSATPSEMANLAIMMLNEGVFRGRRLLQAASVREMGLNQGVDEPLRPVATDFFGLGWDGVQEAGFAAVGVRAWHKSGGTNIYSTQLVVLPDEGLAVMITGAGTAYGALALCERILLDALVERGRLARFPAPVVVPETLAKVAATDAGLAEMTGVYAANHPGKIVRIRQRDRLLEMAQLVDGEWAAPTLLAFYNDGRFRADADLTTSYWSVLAQGNRYLATEVPGAVMGSGLKHAWQAYPAMQQLPPRQAVSSAWKERGTLEGLLVNCEPGSSSMREPLAPLLQVAPPELAGYVVGFDGVPRDASGSDDVATMCMKLPVFFGRDLNDLEVLKRSGQEFFRLGSFVFRPSDRIPSLATGTGTVAIGADGYAEWRKLPGGGRLATRGATAWILYDAGFKWRAGADGDASVALGAADAYLLVYGAANASVAVSVT